jgi:hypothetical protein
MGLLPQLLLLLLQNGLLVVLLQRLLVVELLRPSEIVVRVLVRVWLVLMVFRPIILLVSKVRMLWEVAV